MSNSSMVAYTQISPNKNTGRVHKTYNPSGAIDKITIHHMAGDLSIETCGNVFAPTSRQASSNYGIGSDGRVGMYVDEGDRSWCSSSPANDYRAVTIEVANCSTGGDWPVSDAALNSLIELCADICRRNGFTLNYDGTKNGSLTKHNMFSATTCPGPYLESKFDYIVQQVNAKLGATSSSSGSTSTATATKSNDEIANEVIKGDWGTGTDRKNRLTAAGYDYATIQALVNQKLGIKTSSTSSSTSSSVSSYYVVGKAYATQVDNLRVRTGAGTNYAVKAKSQLTADGQKNSNSSGELNKGTVVTCKAVQTVGKDVWIQTPSGWIAAFYGGQYYVK